MLFSKFIYILEDQNKPIFTFQQKQGVFYIYEPSTQETNQLPTNNWQQLSREKLIQFLNRCLRKLSKALSDWKKANVEKMKSDDKYSMEYDKAMSKVMGTDFKQESIFSKSKTMIYNNLKTDIKSFVEYEFEF
jgi:hypothetical protein